MSLKYRYGHPEASEDLTTGFDCSGLVPYVLGQCGLTVPNFIGMDGSVRPIRHTSEFFDHYGIFVHTPKPGDLVFFSYDGGFSPTHIGIMIDSERYIHAPGRDETYVDISQVVERDIASDTDIEDAPPYSHNPIGYKSPTVAKANPTYRWHQMPI